MNLFKSTMKCNFLVSELKLAILFVHGKQCEDIQVTIVLLFIVFVFILL